MTEISTNKTYFITMSSQQDVKHFKTSFIPIFFGPEVPGLDIIVRSECVLNVEQPVTALMIKIHAGIVSGSLNYL